MQQTHDLAVMGSFSLGQAAFRPHEDAIVGRAANF